MKITDIGTNPDSASNEKAPTSLTRALFGSNRMPGMAQGSGLTSRMARRAAVRYDRAERRQEPRPAARNPKGFG